MKMKAFLSIMAVVLIHSGCATMNLTPVVGKSNIQGAIILNLEQRKTIGEPMVSITDGQVKPGFLAEEDYQEPSNLGLKYPTIAKGSTWIAKSINNDDGSFICSRYVPGLTEKQMDHLFYQIVLGKESDYPVFIVIGKDNKLKKFYWTTYSATTTGTISFSPIDLFVIGSMRQEFIYNGKSGSTLKFTYREYKDDFARPAFFQDLTYDMNESNTIGFRGMAIEVIEATNSFIKFKIVKPMNPAT